VAFALDMYGTGKLATHPKDAKKFMQALMGDQTEVMKRYQAALDLLKAESFVDTEHLASIGYCMGGGISLNMARTGIDLDAVVSFHGSLATEKPAKLNAIKAKLLILNGAADPFVPEQQVKNFESEMQAAKADYELINYPNVKHSFTNPDADKFGQTFNLPLAYDKAADADSWQRLQVFLQTVFDK